MGLLDSTYICVLTPLQLSENLICSNDGVLVDSTGPILDIFMGMTSNSHNSWAFFWPLTWYEFMEEGTITSGWPC